MSEMSNTPVEKQANGTHELRNILLSIALSLIFMLILFIYGLPYALNKTSHLPKISNQQKAENAIRDLIKRDPHELFFTYRIAIDNNKRKIDSFYQLTTYLQPIEEDSTYNKLHHDFLSIEDDYTNIKTYITRISKHLDTLESTTDTSIREDFRKGSKIYFRKSKELQDYTNSYVGKPVNYFIMFIMKENNQFTSKLKYSYAVKLDTLFNIKSIEELDPITLKPFIPQRPFIGSLMDCIIN